MPAMRRFLLRLITAIQLTRLTMAFGAVSDLLVVILLSRALPGYESTPVGRMELLPALLAGVTVAIGLFAYGAALNDVLDVRHDAAFSPDRPIPAGRIRPGQAVVVTVGALIMAMLAAELFGTPALWLSMLTAAALLFYNTTGKFIPSVGIVTVGLIHAAHMFIPNCALSFTLPIWLVMTHVMATNVLVHMLEEKRPRLTRRSLLAAGAGWAFWSAILLSVGVTRGDGLWPDGVSPLASLYPLAAILGFIVIARWKTRRVPGRVGAEKLKRYGAMWQCLYGAAWMLALDLDIQALWLGLFALVGFAGMTLIKEVMGLSGKSLTYRT